MIFSSSSAKVWISTLKYIGTKHLGLGIMANETRTDDYKQFYFFNLFKQNERAK